MICGLWTLWSSHTLCKWLVARRSFFGPAGIVDFIFSFSFCRCWPSPLHFAVIVVVYFTAEMALVQTVLAPLEVVWHILLRFYTKSLLHDLLTIMEGGRPNRHLHPGTRAETWLVDKTFWLCSRCAINTMQCIVVSTNNMIRTGRDRAVYSTACKGPPNVLSV